MSKYVMSDLHGEYDKYLAMLKKIEFSDEKDELYIIGDILDRGKKPLEILDHIVAHKNITLLKGNHELLFQEAHETGDVVSWHYNGGLSTFSEITARGQDCEDMLYRHIKKLPIIKIVDKFILVHAGLYFPRGYEDISLEEFINLQEEETCLWTRENVGNEKQYRDYTVVCGHTPTSLITKTKDNSILKRPGTIYIDCGACFFDGRLACLRLDDMKEFYV